MKKIVILRHISAVIFLFFNTPIYGQDSTFLKGDSDQSIIIWKIWGCLSENMFFMEYKKSFDPWLREHVPGIPPLRAEEGNTRLTSGFGMRKHPIEDGFRFHNGLDLSGSPGQLVYATATGIVDKTGFDQRLGKYIVISHAGMFLTYYGHLSEILVKEGQYIKWGDYIGRIGNTGLSTGNHLHYIIKRLGKEVDPEPYLFLRFSSSDF